jgi:orotidine-5'-phosphate decarboxylase
MSVGELLDTPILGPGFGEQGAAFADLSKIYGLAAKNVVVTVSRSVLRAGPSGIAAEIEKQAADLAEATA